MAVLTRDALAEADFFRPAALYDALNYGLVPALMEQRASERSLRFWCAGVAAQDAYSLALLLGDQAALPGWEVSILASLAGADGWEAARDGRFSQFQVNRGLPAVLLVKHFERNGIDWQVGERIRRLVEWSETDLLATGAGLCPLDLIWLRVGVPGRAGKARKAIWESARLGLRPGGYLLVGTAAEPVTGLDEIFEPVRFGSIVAYRAAEGMSSAMHGAEALPTASWACGEEQFGDHGSE